MYFIYIHSPQHTTDSFLAFTVGSAYLWQMTGSSHSVMTRKQQAVAWPSVLPTLVSVKFSALFRCLPSITPKTYSCGDLITSLVCS